MKDRVDAESEKRKSVSNGEKRMRLSNGKKNNKKVKMSVREKGTKEY